MDGKCVCPAISMLSPVTWSTTFDCPYLLTITTMTTITTSVMMTTKVTVTADAMDDTAFVYVETVVVGASAVSVYSKKNSI